MCLSIKVNRPDHVLSEGKHSGFKWITVHNGGGSRCGYIRIPKGHPWHGIHYNNIDADVHGGLTFAEADEPCELPGDDDAWWIGFDCAHLGDAPDPDLPNFRDVNRELGVSVYRLFSDILGSEVDIGMNGDTIRTQEYVEAECKSLCEQAFSVKV